MEINKYQRGKIYKIVDNMTDKIYIGSTCEPTLARRLSGHVREYKSYLNGKNHYVSSFDIIAMADYDIILVELCPCNSKDELLARERHYKENLICVNKNRPIISNVERNEYYAKYRTEHQDEHREHTNTKYECLICSGKYTYAHKASHIKSQRHQNAISLNGILSNHQTMMQKLDQIIEQVTNFLQQSENFFNVLNI